MSYSHNDTPNGSNNNGSPTEATAKLVFYCFSSFCTWVLGNGVTYPSLKIGVTQATFHESGKRLVSTDVLNKKASEFPIKGSASFKK